MFPSSISHCETRSQKPWQFFGLGLLFFPLSPFLGGLCIVTATAWVWRQQFGAIIRSRLNQGLMIFCLLLVISASTAIDPKTAWLGLFNFIPFIVIFAALSLLLRGPEQLRQIAWNIQIASIPVVAIGIGQMYSGWHGPIEILWVLVDWQLEPNGTPPDRMASVFEYANTLASYSLIVWLLGLGLWIETYRTVRQLTPAQVESRYGRQMQWRWRFLSAVSIGQVIVLTATSSRTAWGVAILGGLAYALYLGWRWLVGGVLSLSAVVLGAVFAPSPINQGLRAIVPQFIWARLTDELYPDRPLAQLRSTQWQFAVRMTLERPGTGWGLRNFTPLYEQQMHLWLGHPHNLVLMLSAETGIPATVLLLGLVGWAVGSGVKTLRAQIPASEAEKGDRLIYFSYLVTFIGITLFHGLDITLFDARINLLGWLLLAGIWGNAQQVSGAADKEKSDRQKKFDPDGNLFLSRDDYYP
jgi:O-antigen ligase